MAHTYVIGDIGGHASELVGALVGLGADPKTLELPDATYVIQVGDLIDRGPDSEWALEVARTAWVVNDGRYIQLIGNHEMNYLAAQPVFVHDFDVRVESALFEFAQAGGLYVAAGIEGESGAWLASHAGLTYGAWVRLGACCDVASVVGRLNDGWELGAAAVWNTGRMLSGESLNEGAGVLWADAASELIGSWRNKTCPFYQVSGHSSLFRFASRRWLVHSAERTHVTLDEAQHHVTWRGANNHFVGIDPQFSRVSHSSWRPYAVNGETLVTGRAVKCLGGGLSPSRLFDLGSTA